MILLIKHVIGFIFVLLCGSIYSYLNAVTANILLKVTFSFAYAFAAILAYIYIYDLSSNKVKRFGSAFTFLISITAYYLSWEIWVTVRSDYQLILFDNPALMFENIIDTAKNANLKLVHIDYPESDNAAALLYIYWILEFIAMVVLPTGFALQAITSYTDDISVEEINENLFSCE